MVVDEANNTITYISPEETTDENVNVYKKFDDVPADAWYESYLSHLVQLGIIQGVSADEFAPNAYVTRAQFATMLALAADADLSSYRGVSSFTDVPADAWYAPQVEWAYQKGLIKGRGNGLFCPESNLTREEAAALIDRYAVSEDSAVLEENQYELASNAGEYLSDEEIALLKGLLAGPVYNDEDAVSDWAAEDVDEVSDAGLICGDENGNLNPQEPLKRSECVKIISAYIINDTKPTFYFPGGSYIEYLGDDDETTAGVSETDDTGTEICEFNGYGDPPDLDAMLGNRGNSGGITVSWARITHCSMTDMAFQKLAADRPKITNKMTSSGEEFLYSYRDLNNNYTAKYLNGLQAIEIYSYYTDAIEYEHNHNGHFYDPDLGCGLDPEHSSENAYQYFNDHFYNAFTSYMNGSKRQSYSQMGMSIHYLEDMNNPYHAALKGSTGDNSQHHLYEAWVPASIGIPSILNSDLTSSYRYVYDSTFEAMSYSFAKLAKNSYATCNLFNSGSSQNINNARAATIENMARTERAVAGILNRYFYYVWLNH